LFRFTAIRRWQVKTKQICFDYGLLQDYLIEVSQHVLYVRESFHLDLTSHRSLKIEHFYKNAVRPS